MEASELALSPPQIACISPVMRHVKTGDFLFRNGDRSVGIYFVASGCLRMQRITPDGSTVVLHTARNDEFFAEASLFVDRYQCDVIAEQDSDVWFYAKRDLMNRLHDNPQALWEFAANLARSLHDIRQRYELKQIRSAPDRVMQLLRLRCNAEGFYPARGTLKDMAAELGLTHEALYRALATLEKGKRIRRDAGVLRILSCKQGSP
jgi:CRP-like cAMP-binding protein